MNPQHTTHTVYVTVDAPVPPQQTPFLEHNLRCAIRRILSDYDLTGVSIQIIGMPQKTPQTHLPKPAQKKVSGDDVSETPTGEPVSVEPSNSFRERQVLDPALMPS